MSSKSKKDSESTVGKGNSKFYIKLIVLSFENRYIKKSPPTSSSFLE